MRTLLRKVDCWSEWIEDPSEKDGGGYFRPLVWLDLGCGQVGEAVTLTGEAESTYVGIDLDPPPVESFNLSTAQSSPRCVRRREPEYEHRTLKLSYRDVEALAAALKKAGIDFDRVSVATSLFSSEITASPEENRAFYEKLFETFPALQHLIVSGFYYSNRIDENPVSEAGGLTSWQTNWRHGEYRSDIYSEVRLVQETPSTLFGDDVVEVWRRLSRRG